jgi:hypothetical protein
MARRMDKDAFKKGCEAGHGSYIENPDGSFQCTTSGGGVIKCKDTTSPCPYTEQTIGTGGKRGHGQVAAISSAGALQALGVQPAPVPTKVVVLSGAAKAKASSVSAP